MVHALGKHTMSKTNGINKPSKQIILRKNTLVQELNSRQHFVYNFANPLDPFDPLTGLENDCRLDRVDKNAFVNLNNLSELSLSNICLVDQSLFSSVGSHKLETISLSVCEQCHLANHVDILDQIKHLTRLGSMTLVGWNLSRMQPNSFQPFLNLNSLTIVDGCFNMTKSAFNGLIRLKQLHLGGFGVKLASGCFIGLENLQELTIDSADHKFASQDTFWRELKQIGTLKVLSCINFGFLKNA